MGAVFPDQGDAPQQRSGFASRCMWAICTEILSKND